MNNWPPASIVIENFSDLKHKINKWPYIYDVFDLRFIVSYPI